MNEQYEFMRAELVRKGNTKTFWELLSSEGKKQIEVEVKTESITMDLLNVLGQDGWHFGVRSGEYEFLQRQKEQTS